MEELMPVISQAIVTIMLTVITAVIGAVGTWLSLFLKSKLKSNQLELLEQIAASVVLAVEQNTYGTELVNDGKAKKDMALNYITEYLSKYSITVDPKLLDVAIESAVANVLNAHKLVEPPQMVELDNQSSGFLD